MYRRHAPWLLATYLTCGGLGSEPVPVAHAETEAGIELAVAPFLPSRTIIQNYQPLRLYLEKQLHRPVTIVTAPNYRSFQERTRQHEYSVIITVAHAAWLAASESGYQPMLRPVTDTTPTLVVAKSSTLTHLQELRGKVITLPDPLAIVSMQARTELLEAGMDPGRDVILHHLSTHSAAVNYVLSGEATAAIVSDRALQQMPQNIQDSVRVVHRWTKSAAPGVVYLASPTLPGPLVVQMTNAILRFTRDTPEGREQMKKWGYGGFGPATVQDLQRFAPYAALLKQELEKAEKLPVPRETSKTQ